MGSEYIRHELLRNESIRMITLINFNFSLKDRKIITRSGMYFEPNLDSFICFSCNLIMDKRTDIYTISIKHCKENINCKFIKNRDISIRYNRGQFLKSCDVYRNHIIDDNENDMVEIIEDFNLEYCNTIQKPECNTIKFLRYLDSPLYIPQGGYTNSEFDVEKFFVAMRSEKHRLQTFRIQNHSYPTFHIAPHFVEFLAKNGFIYCLSGMNIQCVFCRKIFGDYDDMDDILLIHESYSRYCNFNIPEMRKKLNLPIEPLKMLDEESNLGQKLDYTLLCKICCEKSLNITFSCGHLYMCEDCSKRTSNCPICKKKLESPLKIFIS